MVSHVATVAFVGVEARAVDVQVQISSGLPAFTIVGLADKAVAESRERVRGALAAIGLAMPPKHITVNLAPADLPKEGSHYDLPIAVGLLATMDVLPGPELERFIVLGELALDGAIAPVAGVLPAAMHAVGTDRGLICGAGNGSEAAWAGDLEILAPTSLLALVNHFKGSQVLSQPSPALAEDIVKVPDLKDIKGQETAKRGLEVAAAGGHNILMIGPPGAGKSMLASRLPGILPPLGPAEALDVTMIQSVAGLLTDGAITRRRPFRDPHHSASMAAMVGGGTRVRPGEASLAHRGVLFLDELPEFQRAVLDSLRQPLETGQIMVARANSHVTFPARVQLVAAMNPCRCGNFGDPALACNRAPKCATDYQTKISGPLYDRIDIHLDVPPVTPGDLALPPPAEGTREVSRRVMEARAIQQARYAGMDTIEPVHTNAEADGEILEAVATPDRDGQKLLSEAAEQMRLTARGYHRVLRVSRTLADLEASDGVRRVHVAEALSYRRVELPR